MSMEKHILVDFDTQKQERDYFRIPVHLDMHNKIHPN